MNEHLDIFSGIGGFALAAQWAGFRTVAFCESDARCRAFLEKRWGLTVHYDIRKLDGRLYAGVSLLTGGPPCQPASRAGKQGGEGDDRWLWPEALRVLEEAKPDCVVFENPPGILDVGLDGILSEMGRIGYEVQCFDIPACAVDSPQLRHRIWIVGFLANAESRGLGTDGSASRSSGHTDERGENSDMANASRDSERGIRAETGADSKRVGQSDKPDGGDVADTEGAGHEERGVQPGIRSGEESANARQAPDLGSQSLVAEGHWQNAIWVPCADGKLRRAPDDSFMLVDGLHRSLLGALGNSICPQVAYEILKAVRISLRHLAV